MSPITIAHAVFVGLVAAAAVWLSVLAGFPVWAVFLGWAGYFVLASGARTGFLAAAQIIAGLILGAALVQLNGLLAPTLGVYSLMLLAFAFGSAFVFVEGLAPLNNIPAYYFGVIAMIASGLRPEPKSVVRLAVSISLGLALGWLLVYGRTRISDVASAYGWFSGKRGKRPA